MENLTSKQKAVANLVLKGLSNHEIATTLNLTVKGVKFHLTNIFKKENVNSRTKLIVKYLPILKERFINEYTTK